MKDQATVRRLERATPREEMEAMQLGLDACEILATIGNWDLRSSWKAKAEKIRDIIRRAQNGYKGL